MSAPKHFEECDKSEAEVGLDALRSAGVVTESQHSDAVHYLRERNAADADIYLPAASAATRR